MYELIIRNISGNCEKTVYFRSRNLIKVMEYLNSFNTEVKERAQIFNKGTKKAFYTGKNF